MKTRHARNSGLPAFLAAILLLALAGCGNAAQERAFAQARQLEEKFAVETAPAVLQAYREVIALEPGSALAQAATARIAAVEARVKAEEQHKAVFQEHGVD